MLKQISAVAGELNKSNQKLTIYPGSILSELNPTEAAYNNNFNGLDVKIASVLGNEITNIKDNIIPVIGEFGKIVSKKIEDSRQGDVFSNISITTAEVPEVIEELISRNIININGHIVTLSNTTIMIPTPEVSVIRSYLKAGGGQMEKLVKEYASTVSDEELVTIWETYLNRISSDNNAYVKLGTKVTNGRYGLDLFILSIIVKSIKHDIPSGVRAASNTYDDVMNNLDMVLDGKIAALVKYIDSNVKLGKLILKADGVEDIMVIREVYNKFLKDGGEPELIYGAVLNGSKSASIATILDNRDKYLSAWNKYVSNETVKNKMGTVEQYRMAYRLGLTDILENYISDEVKLQIDDEFLHNSGVLLIEYMNSINYMDLFEVNQVVEYIVCDMMFKYTNAGRFIDYMKHYGNMDKNITAKEAATYASLDLVIDYLLTQVTIK